MQEIFGIHVFDFNRLKENLPSPIAEKFQKTIDQKKVLDNDVADMVAREIKKWAESMQVTHYVHWFLPLTELTAGKQNSFLDRSPDGRIIANFSGKDLIKGEPDASSFPHGGMRSTFEARGYTAWDPSSPVFVSKNDKSTILYIPSVFFGFNGKVLDKKTPLLRSQKLVNEIALQMVRRFHPRAKWVKVMAGPEQEFFLVDGDDFHRRPDLRSCGRIILAAPPPKGQQLNDHYFGVIPEKVLEFLESLEESALQLGVPIKTRHNEVAPNQFEVAPVYEEANIAADHNQILMELLPKTARKHGMVCIMHEKPFPFFNGSGKHINWSLETSLGQNLFSPGESKSSRLLFLHFLTAFIVGFHTHHDLLQASLSSPGNELRLGGHEAPPAIISIYLGEELQAIITDMRRFVDNRLKKAGTIRVEDLVPSILHDISDRNRTSPVAFTGNKFEFRMPGSSASISFPLAVINLIMVDGLREVLAATEGIKAEHGLLTVLQGLIREHHEIVFEGDNYCQDWQEEAIRRNLFIPKSPPETIQLLRSEKNVSLFERHQILKRDEIEARAEIKTEMYWKTVEIELQVARYMLRAYIIPAALKNQQLLLAAVIGYPREILDRTPTILDNQNRFIEKFTGKINRVMEMIQTLDEDNERIKAGDNLEKALFCSRVIRPHLLEALHLVEKIEERVDRTFWPMPRISDLLFR